MVEALLHFLIPFVALIIYNNRFKMALALSLVALTPDLDLLFNVHRSMSHSIFFILCITIVLIILLHKTEYKKYISFIFLSYTSHIFLDMFQTYTPVFYPLYENSIYVYTRLVISMSTMSNLLFEFEIRHSSDVCCGPPPDIFGTIISGGGLAIAFIFIVAYALSKYNRRLKYE